MRAEERACGSAVLHGPKGVSYGWGAAPPGSINFIGALIVRIGEATKPFSLPFHAVTSGDPLVFQSTSCTATKTRMTSKTNFRTGASQAQLQVTLSADNDILTIEFMGEQGFSVNLLETTGWPANLDPEAVPVPYDSFPVFRLRAAGLFANRYWDWTSSNATILSANGAEYWALTDAHRNTLRERLIVKLAANLVDVLPEIPNSPSPYLSEVAGRLVIDIWGPAFSTIANTLAHLQRAGLKDCVVLIHVWQHDGYDNGLPEHYPANSTLGGENALASAIQAGKNAGCLVGLHENYVDYYPNYPGFDPKAIALDAKGLPQKAWFNSGTSIQSFAARPNLYVTNASGQSPEIHRRYATSASFIDVNSSTFPWWRADLDATAPAAGTFSSYRQASRDLWAFERESHAGPVFGEGQQQWFWSGQLDGVEAQLGAADIHADKPAYPLFVDFDLLRIHPLQVNHGMGYYSRWLPSGRTIHETELLDAYRMQEIAFGHAPFIGAEMWDNVPQVLTEQNLVGPVAKRYGTATVQSIRYEINGVWADTNAAVAARDWSRVAVTYSNGDQLVANTRKDPLTWQGLLIPQYGWAAKGPGLLAFTAISDGQIVDYAETADSYFANARNQNDLANYGILAAPKVTRFTQTGSGSAEIQISWSVLNRSNPERLTNFVHFVAANGAIVFGADHTPERPTSEWTAGQTIVDTFPVRLPASAPDGSYSLRVGLYAPATGSRVPLLGRSDGTTRYVLGDLIVSGGGAGLAFEPGPDMPRVNDPRLNSAGKTIDFGVIQTDGMVSLVRSGSGWILRAYPSNRDVTIHLNSKVFPPPAAVVCASDKPNSQVPEVSSGFWSLRTAGSNDCAW